MEPLGQRSARLDTFRDTDGACEAVPRNVTETWPLVLATRHGDGPSRLRWAYLTSLRLRPMVVGTCHCRVHNEGVFRERVGGGACGIVGWRGARQAEEVTQRRQNLGSPRVPPMVGRKIEPHIQQSIKPRWLHIQPSSRGPLEAVIEHAGVLCFFPASM